MSPSEQTRLSGSQKTFLQTLDNTSEKKHHWCSSPHQIHPRSLRHCGRCRKSSQHFLKHSWPHNSRPPIGSHRHPSAPSSSSQSLCGSWWLWSTCLHLCLHSQTHQLLRVNLLRVRGPEALKSSVQTDRKQINHYCSRFLSTWGRVQDKSESTWAPSQDIRSETKQSSKSPSQHSKKRR